MTLHFVHIGKTGGSALKVALRRSGYATWKPEEAAALPQTPYGAIVLHRHGFRLADLPPGDHVFFAVRDPISRFVSGYFSRLDKGRPRFYREWTELERQVFETFPTPQRLALALTSEDEAKRELARRAMHRVGHLRSIRWNVGSVREIRARRHQIVFIARQETLAGDWEELKLLLGLPMSTMLPTGVKRSHRRPVPLEDTLDEVAVRTLRQWYRHDFRIVRYCETMRAWRGWGAGAQPPGGLDRLRHEARRLRGLPAILPPPPMAISRRLYRVGGP